VRIACVRLDGIPLAIELAAAWSGTLSAQEILRGLDDQFALLIRGPRGVAARHQTLAASMAWSHDLLSDADRVLFRRLGAFQGGFTLDAASGVCAFDGLDQAGVLGGLRRLVDKSLIIADTRGAVARYRMLETIRQYAAARLAASTEQEIVRDRHLAAFLRLTEDTAPLLDQDKDAWRVIIGTEQENLRAALEWGLSLDDPHRGRRLAADLSWLWHLSRQPRWVPTCGQRWETRNTRPPGPRVSRSTYATRSTMPGAPEANGAGRQAGGPASPRPSRAWCGWPRTDSATPTSGHDCS
jgi:predicted ATPase